MYMYICQINISEGIFIRVGAAGFFCGHFCDFEAFLASLSGTYLGSKLCPGGLTFEPLQ